MLKCTDLVCVAAAAGVFRFFLPSSIQTATFLTPEQRHALLESFKQASTPSPPPPPPPTISRPASAAAYELGQKKEALAQGATISLTGIEGLDTSHHHSDHQHFQHHYTDHERQQQQQQSQQQQLKSGQQWQQLQEQEESYSSEVPGEVPSSPAGGEVHHSSDDELRTDHQRLLEGGHTSSSSSGTSGSPGDCDRLPRGVSWHRVWRMWGHPVVRYAGSWRILHDIPGNGVLYWTPIMVQAVLTAMDAGRRQSSPQRLLLPLPSSPVAAASSAAAGTLTATAEAAVTAALPVVRKGPSSVVSLHFLTPGVGTGLWPRPKEALAPGGGVLTSAVGCPASGAATGGFDKVWEQADSAGLSISRSLMVLSRVLVTAGSGEGGADSGVNSQQQPQEQQQQLSGRHGAVAVVLLSSIPYACASLFHVANAWHSQKTQEWRWHIAGVWGLGALALLLLPVLWRWHAALAFVALTVAHVGVNGANGLQTGLVARCFQGQDKALGLAMYNTIGSLGGLLGPFLIGFMVDVLGGYALAMVVLSCCLAAAAAMVWCFKPTVPNEAV